MGRSSGPRDAVSGNVAGPAAREALAVEVARALDHPLLPLEPWAGTASRPGRAAVLEAERRVLTDLVARRPPFDVERLRFEAYRLASVSWEDRWAYGRVARAEELIAESHRQGGRWHDAWLAWRTSWWIRETLRSPGAPRRHYVMGLLHARLERFDDAVTRLTQGLEGAGDHDAARIRTLLQLLSVVDGR